MPARLPGNTPRVATPAGMEGRKNLNNAPAKKDVEQHPWTRPGATNERLTTQGVRKTKKCQNRGINADAKRRKSHRAGPNQNMRKNHENTPEMRPAVGHQDGATARARAVSTDKSNTNAPDGSERNSCQKKTQKKHNGGKITGELSKIAQREQGKTTNVRKIREKTQEMSNKKNQTQAAKQKCVTS